jgi:hypothetical protein
MMGWKFLPNLSPRLELWRNTIQLFHQCERPNYIGPFKLAGFKYIVDRQYLTKQGEKKKPDIIASGESGWFILDLTYNDKSKESKLVSYMGLDPRFLSSTYGLHGHDKDSDVMSSRLSFVDDGPFCQLIVKDTLMVEKENHLKNTRLKEVLINAKGMNLKNLPQIPIALVPEMHQQEIPASLVDIVLKIFDPSNNGMTINQIVDEGLERLSENISVSDRGDLIIKVKIAMETLIKNHLPEYLTFKDEKYTATDKFKFHYKSMEYIALRLKEWASHTQTTLDNHSS